MVQILMDEAQPVVAVLEAGPELERLAGEPGAGAGIGVVVARQRLDQRGLARAVLAHQGVDLVFAHVQVHVDQGPGPAECLGQAFDLQQGRADLDA